MTTQTARTLLASVPVAVALAAFAWSCAPDPPHGEDNTFPLVGKHEALGCEACHGTDGFEKLPTDCSECHEDDRPLDHYEGDCGDCHVC